MTEPLLLDQFMPQYDHAIVYSQVLRAPPQECFEALVNMDILQTPVIRLLIRARGLPQRVADAVRGRGAEAKEASWPVTFRLRDMAALGWIKLGERPGAELVFGIVGQPWQPVTSQPGEPVAAEQFAGFDEPGFAKIAESTRVDPYGDRFSIVTVESRVALTDEDSRRRFRRYWLMMGSLHETDAPHDHARARTAAAVTESTKRLTPRRQACSWTGDLSKVWACFVVEPNRLGEC